MSRLGVDIRGMGSQLRLSYPRPRQIASGIYDVRPPHNPGECIPHSTGECGFIVNRIPCSQRPATEAAWAITELPRFVLSLAVMFSSRRSMGEQLPSGVKPRRTNSRLTSTTSAKETAVSPCTLAHPHSHGAYMALAEETLRGARQRRLKVKEVRHLQTGFVTEANRSQPALHLLM